jgi:hypothetical protein
LAALRFDLIIDQGTDYNLSIPVLGLADGGTLAGWTATGQIRASYASPTVLHTLDLTVSGTDVVLHIPAATSSAWTWRRGRFDIEVIDPSGAVTRLVEGAVVIRPEITRV